MKIKDIKEKILKRKLKITPLIMALLVAVSSLAVAAPVKAKEIPVYATILEDNIEFYNEFKVGNGSVFSMNYYYKISDSTEPVYLLNIVDDCFENGSIGMSTWLISKGTYKGYYKNGSSYSTFNKNGYGAYLVCNMGTFLPSSYEAVKGSENTSFLLISSIKDEITLSGTDYATRYTPLFDYLYSNNMQIGTETIEMNYAGSSSENIENVLGVLMNPYTGGKDGDEWTFLWKWTPPNDSDLIMEIMADVEYVDNLGDSLLTAVKNSWSTASVSLYEYEDGLLGSNGHLRFSYDYIKEKLSEELGEDIGFFGKVRLKNVYFRYARFNEESDSVEYGNYTTFTPTYRSYMDTQPKVGTVTYPTGQFHSGVTESYNPKTDTIPETYIKVQDPSEGVGSADDLFGAVRSYLNSGKGFIGDFPSLMGDIFQNIPPQITALITIGLGLLIVLRLFGR